LVLEEALVLEDALACCRGGGAEVGESLVLSQLLVSDLSDNGTLLFLLFFFTGALCEFL
jgi:hypothetical protein|tara:strand:+ start:113 stop:289 length:177 start_codon:yes stop_codon:yes gene_type:complete